MTRRDGTLRLALPSDRMMEGETLAFMEKCGLSVHRTSSRQYVGSLLSVPGVEVLFQRSVDIPHRLDSGDVDMGIVGLERFLEDCVEDGDSLVVLENLGYSFTDLVMAVPDAWTDVRTMANLASYSGSRHSHDDPLRVATKYHRQVGRFLEQHKVPDYRLVHINGAIEAAPLIGTADVVSDLASSGATLRENHLRPLDDGTITKSAACMVANLRLLRGQREKMSAAKTMLELIESRLRAQSYYNIIANIRGDSMESVAALVNENPAVSGMQGPTVSRVFSKERSGDWFSVSVVVEVTRLTGSVDYLRGIGASGVVVTPAHYVFDHESEAFERLKGAVEVVS